MRRIATPLLLLIAFAANRPVAVGSPTIQIRSYSEVTIDSIVRDDGVTGLLHIKGRLRRSPAFSPITNSGLKVTIENPFGERFEAGATSNGDGLFVASTYDVGDGVYTVEVSYPGDSEFAASQATRKLELGKESVALELSVTGELPLDSVELNGTVSIKALGVPIGRSIRLDLILIPEGTLIGRKSVQSSAKTGTAKFSLPIARAHVDDQFKLVAESESDQRYAAARAEARVRRIVSTSIELAGPKSPVNGSDTLRMSGRLTSTPPGYEKSQPVALFQGTNRIADTLTDATGHFEFAFPASEFSAGTIAFVAEFQPTSKSMRSARSQPLLVTLRAVSQRFRWLPVLVILAAALALAFGYWLIAQAKKRRTPPPAPARVRGLAQRPRPAKIRLSKPTSFRFSGVVLDATTDRPISGAQIAAELPIAIGAPAELIETKRTGANAKGRFLLADLPAGQIQCQVTAPGVLPEKFSITLPHTGEFEEVEIRLVAIRDAVTQVFHDAIAPAIARTPRPPETARKLRDLAEPKIAEEAKAPLNELTDLADASRYSARIPDISTLDKAQTLAPAIVRKTENRPPS